MSKKQLRMIAAFLVLGFVGLATCVWWVGGALVASANQTVTKPSDDLPFEELLIPSDSGAQLATWHIAAPDSTATMLLFHPIRGNRMSMLGRARLMHQAGFDVIMIDMQAHGESQGDQITVGYLESHDVKAAVAFAKTKNPSHRIGIIGCSLGGAATLLAGPLDVDAVVLESVYATIDEAIYNRISMRVGFASHLLTPLLTMQLSPRLGVSPNDLRPIDHIASIGCPVLVASGNQDQQTPIAETQRLYDAAAEPKQLLVFPGAAHVDLLQHNQDLYKKEVVAFLKSHLTSSAEPSRSE